MGYQDLYILGLKIGIWNAILLVAVAAAYPVLQRCIHGFSFPHPAIRFAVVVYLSALAAKLFAHWFDATGSFAPPPGASAVDWYLNPVTGPKTLYGVIVLMPISMSIGKLGADLSLSQALDLCTPPMFVILAIARVGCFLRGCCYGAPSDLFGIGFPVGSPAYLHQLEDGVIASGSLPLPVIPTQAIEAVFLAAIARWAFRRWDTSPRTGSFFPAIAAYSAFRFAIEFVRADDERGVYGLLATSQWIALAVLGLLGISVFFRHRILARS